VLRDLYTVFKVLKVQCPVCAHRVSEHTGPDGCTRGRFSSKPCPCGITVQVIYKGRR